MAEPRMTKAERAELGKLLRLRGKVAKDDIESRAAWLLADVEAKLAATYSSQHAAWKEIVAAAKETLSQADQKIAEHCRALGIPESFRPSLGSYWCERGENALNARRVELRRVAQTEIAARAKTAKVKVDRHTAALLTRLAEDALESSQAKDFLTSMPSIDELMPQLTLDELKVPALESRWGGVA